MAGDWIQVRQDLLTDPDVLRMARLMGCSRHEVGGLLIEFWSWVSNATADGNLSRCERDDIDAVVSRPALIDALIEVGWLTKTATGFAVPNFDTWLSSGAKSRLQASRRQKRSRSKRHAPVTKMSRSKRDKSVTREEKRREEKKKKTEQTVLLSQEPIGSCSSKSASSSDSALAGSSNGRAKSPRKPRGSPSGSPPLQAQFLAWWSEEWFRTRGASWTPSKLDFVLAAKALKLAGGDLQEVKNRALRLLEDGENAWIAKNASLNLLVSRWNQLAVTVIRTQSRMASNISAILRAGKQT